MGRVTLDKVPARYHDAVVKILQEMDAEYNTGLKWRTSSVNDIIIEGLSTVISLAVGGQAGYVIAYVTGLRAVRKWW